MRILIVYTGGTIGMVKEKVKGALCPGSINAIDDFLSGHFLRPYCDLTSLSKIIDSSNFGKETFRELASLIEESYHQYDAFLVLMGTDTMAYISSLLSFCITGLSKSIVFTGGQNPLFKEKSDSEINFNEALSSLYNNQFPKEVGVYFAKKWHRAVAVTKVDTQKTQAYISPHSITEYSAVKEDFSVLTQVFSNVVVLKLTPFHHEDVFFAILEQKNIQGIVLEVFGSGNIPEFTLALKQLFKNRISEGLKVAVTSQCLYGVVELGKYQASLAIQSLGFLSAGAMTTEATVAKMTYLLEKKLNIQEYESFFENSIRGESICY